jgi:hypothetical protein
MHASKQRKLLIKILHYAINFYVCMRVNISLVFAPHEFSLALSESLTKTVKCDHVKKHDGSVPVYRLGISVFQFCSSFLMSQHSVTQFARYC